MPFVSQVQPLCRCCGKPIRKYTTTVWFGRTEVKTDRFSKQLTEKPLSPEQAQKYVNEKIVSCRYSECEGEKGRYLYKATTWDGESYEEEFFCKNDCARRFAIIMVKGGHCTVAYKQAKDVQDAKVGG